MYRAGIVVAGIINFIGINLNHMTIKKCDVCQNDIPDKSWFSVSIRSIAIFYDLCDECSKPIKDYLFENNLSLER